jgi:DNA-binding response OmpR family regulator
MKQARRILVLEDDDVLRRQLRILLEAERYIITDVGKITAAKDFLGQESSFAAFIIDWSLPDGEGTEIISMIRATGCLAPIFLLTARANLTDRVVGLKLGATDYVIKPFEPLELLARLDRHISTYEQLQGKETGEDLVLGDIRIDKSRHQAFWQGEQVELTRLQFNLLVFLCKAPDKVFTRDELLNEVWGLDKYPTTRTIDNHIAQLRQKFAADYFVTLHGLGYKFTVPSKICHE